MLLLTDIGKWVADDNFCLLRVSVTDLNDLTDARFELPDLRIWPVPTL